MTTTLHDRLSELADDAPLSVPQPGLWQRGVRFRRRRRLGSTVIVGCAVLLLLGLSAVTWHRSMPTTRPATSSSPEALPDRLYQPSPWLPGTNKAGPLGPIAAIVEADRKTLLHTAYNQLVGISARTGAYRFLDLPDMAPISSFAPSYALSPDGRRLAYWIEGRASRTSRPEVVGVAVYDTSTGQVQTHRIPSDYGLTGQGLIWAGAGTLILEYEPDTNATRANIRTGPIAAWDLDASTYVALPGLSSGDLLAGAPGVVLAGVHGLSVVDDRTGARIRRFRSPGGSVGTMSLDPTAQRVALITGSTDPGPVSVISADGAPTVVPNSEGTYGVVAWADADHVVVLNDGGASSDHAVLEALDVSTGRSRTLMTFGPAQFNFREVVATDLLSEPSVPGVRPPSPVSHRLLAVGGAGVLVGAALALLMWRRRVRP